MAHSIVGTVPRRPAPTPAEDFDALYYVTLHEDGFSVQEWRDAV